MFLNYGNKSQTMSDAPGNVPCFSLLGQVTYKIYPQIQDFKHVLDLIFK